MRNINSETPDNSTLVLNWQPPEPTNGDILYYVVEVTQHENDNVIVEGNTTNTTFTATNLSKQSFFQGHT